jgi:hypothetical protein
MVELEINIGDVEIRQPGFKSSTPRGNLEGAESADYRPNSIWIWQKNAWEIEIQTWKLDELGFCRISSNMPNLWTLKTAL